MRMASKVTVIPAINAPTLEPSVSDLESLRDCDEKALTSQSPPVKG